MRKFLLLFFLFFVFFIESTSLDIYSFNENNIKIISRKEWGADESYRYRDGLYWAEKLKKIEEDSKNYTEEEKESIKKASEVRNKIDTFLLKNYQEQNTLVSVIKEQNGHKLVWPIQKTNYVNAIVIHHTDTNYETSLESMKKIYKFHALTRGRGDIGYNYLIGYDGEIYEGRAGGDYTVGAHDLWNNRSTIGIAFIGYYQEQDLNEKQKESLDKLVKFLVKKYGIDLNKNFFYHKDCKGKCDFYLETNTLTPLIGHRDAGHTTCPGEKVYKFLEELRKNNLDYSKGLKPVSNKRDKNLFVDNKALKEKISKLNDEALLNLLLETEVKIDNIGEKDVLEKQKLLGIKTIILDIFYKKDKTPEIKNEKTSYFDHKNKIKIKLSYPKEDKITISDGDKLFDVKVDGDFLTFDGKKQRALRISSAKRGYLDIVSWKRIPLWDKNGVNNDNKFKGDLLLYIKKGKLIVVNILPLKDYLKGIGEVSDSNNTEKIKTIMIAARTYARWYLEQDRKFPDEIYDGSDDPDVFQNYLGYSFEKRSPNISKIVDETKDIIIKYKGELIKPWYFSKSDGKTLSYYEYCIQKNKPDFCKKESKKYPFLSSVKDPAGIGLKKEGHGVGISGIGSAYLANRGWDYKMIIKYYLNGVSIN